jgi:predicted nucleic acid-binding protein
LITFVLDTSVAAKWVLPPADEPLCEEATSLLRRYKTGDLQLLVPDLFWSELANVFWKAVRRRRWSPTAAHAGLGDILSLQLPTLPSVSLVEKALSIAFAFDRPAYDSMYVALAVSTGFPLITADERLANAMAAHFPVQWLGSV